MLDKGKTKPKPRTPQAFGELDHRIIATVREPLMVLDADLRVIFANDSFLPQDAPFGGRMRPVTSTPKCRAHHPATALARTIASSNQL